MRSLSVLFFTITLLSGCAVSTIKVLEKKDTPKPFANILAIYVDGDIDFSVFDSTTYNICIRPSFMDTAGFETRSNTEDLLINGLSAPRSVFSKSTDLFGLNFSSYSYFVAEMDTLHIDAILLLHLHRYTYTPRGSVSSTYPLGPTGSFYIRPEISYNTPNAAFACYLIRPHEFLPVWRAEIDVKGKGMVNGKHVLKTDMITRIEKNLVTEGYIAPHIKGE